MSMEKNGIIHGTWPVLEALRSGRHVERILLRRDGNPEQAREIRQEAKAHDVPVQFVPSEKLDRLVRGEHQGVAAFVSALSEQDLTEVISMAYERGETPLVVALDGVTDVRNVGAIARSAECLGAHALLVPKTGTARMGPDAVKSSAGALMRLPVCRVNDLTGALRKAQEHGLRVVACTEKGTGPMASVTLTGPTLLVMGSEESGISGPVLRMADDLALIPMAGKIGSLNVSVATGIALYEINAQRAAKNSA